MVEVEKRGKNMELEIKINGAEVKLLAEVVPQDELVEVEDALTQYLLKPVSYLDGEATLFRGYLIAAALRKWNRIDLANLFEPNSFYILGIDPLSVEVGEEVAA
jgi:hypothetical protein